MRFKLFKAMELCSAAVCVAFVYLLGGLYELTDKNPLGVLFGVVNGSIWESMKPIILTYFVYSGLELLAAKPYFRSFVASKAVGLYVCCAVYLLLSYFSPLTMLLRAFAALFLGFLTSYLLMKRGISSFFSLGCFMLLLIFVMYFSFTANPPRLELFRDPYTSLYGIIPTDYDFGADFLEKASFSPFFFK